MVSACSGYTAFCAHSHCSACSAATGWCLVTQRNVTGASGVSNLNTHTYIHMPWYIIHLHGTPSYLSSITSHHRDKILPPHPTPPQSPRDCSRFTGAPQCKLQGAQHRHYLFIPSPGREWGQCNGAASTLDPCHLFTLPTSSVDTHTRFRSGQLWFRHIGPIDAIFVKQIRLLCKWTLYHSRLHSERCGLLLV